MLFRSLHLAKLLQVGGNMLLLDEPTNDLDIETLRALENALLEFPAFPVLQRDSYSRTWKASASGCVSRKRRAARSGPMVWELEGPLPIL